MKRKQCYNFKRKYKNKNMSLLKNLTLSYEMHANDPVEVGIHYGKSILQALSAKVSAMETVAQGPRYIPRETTVTARTVRRTTTAQPERARYATYVSRPLTMELI